MEELHSGPSLIVTVQRDNAISCCQMIIKRYVVLDNTQPHINNIIIIMTLLYTHHEIFSALQSTRGSHGDYLNILMAKVIYPTDAKKVTMLAVAIEIARMIFHDFSWWFFFFSSSVHRQSK